MVLGESIPSRQSDSSSIRQPRGVPWKPLESAGERWTPHLTVPISLPGQ